jgi:hypothetical protein
VCAGSGNAHEPSEARTLCRPVSPVGFFIPTAQPRRLLRVRKPITHSNRNTATNIQPGITGTFAETIAMIRTGNGWQVVR